MSENASSLPESLDVSHLPAHQLRAHLIDLHLALVDELLLHDDRGRLEVLSVMYQNTLNALEQRHWGRR
jgi:hypothetical protein